MSGAAVPGQPGRSTDGRPPRDARGSGTVLTVLVIATVVLAFTVVIVVSGYLVADHRAAAAADHAALSGARAHQQDPGSACAVAERAARLNDARLVSCTVVGDSIDYVVEVTVAVPVPVEWPGLPSSVRSTSRAGHVMSPP